MTFDLEKLSNVKPIVSQIERERERRPLRATTIAKGQGLLGHFLLYHVVNCIFQVTNKKIRYI